VRSPECGVRRVANGAFTLTRLHSGQGPSGPNHLLHGPHHRRWYAPMVGQRLIRSVPEPGGSRSQTPRQQLRDNRSTTHELRPTGTMRVTTEWLAPDGTCHRLAIIRCYQWCAPGGAINGTLDKPPLSGHRRSIIDYRLPFFFDSELRTPDSELRTPDSELRTPDSNRKPAATIPVFTVTVR
jgi:hypothetical protein